MVHQIKTRRKGLKHDLPLSAKKESLSNLISITSLPQELLLRIFKYCFPQDLFQVRQVNSYLFNACKRIPRISTRTFLQRIYQGDLEIIFKLHIGEPYSKEIIKDVQQMAKSQTYRRLRSKHKRDLVKCGRLVLILAIEYQLTYQETDPDLNLNQIIREIQQELHNTDDIHLPELLGSGSADIFCLVTPSLTDTNRFILALQYPAPDLAEEILDRILDNHDSKISFEFLKRTFESHAHHTILIMFTGCEGSKFRGYEYADKYAATKNIPFVLMDAALSGHLCTDNYFQQVVCWIFLSTSMTILKRLLTHPKVDPGRWKSFALRCHIACGEMESLIELIKDPRVNPTLYYNEITSLKGKGKDIELFGALFANPKLKRDYNDIQLIKYCCTWGGYNELFELLVKDPKVNLGVNNNELLFAAVQSQSYRIVDCLLNDPRVNPNARNHQIIADVFASRSSFLIHNVLKHPRVNVSADAHHFLPVAMEKGYVEAVQILLDIVMMDPATNPYELFISFVKLPSPHPDIMKMFLNHDRVEPAAYDNQALGHIYAQIHEQSKTTGSLNIKKVDKYLLDSASLLSQDPRVKQRLSQMRLAP